MTLNLVSVICNPKNSHCGNSRDSGPNQISPGHNPSLNEGNTTHLGHRMEVQVSGSLKVGWEP